jgi:hypothetical protein
MDGMPRAVIHIGTFRLVIICINTLGGCKSRGEMITPLAGNICT